MSRGWGVKAGMVRVWVAGKTVWSPCYTQAISGRFRDKEIIYEALYKFAFFYFTFLRQYRNMCIITIGLCLKISLQNSQRSNIFMQLPHANISQVQ